MIHLSKDPQGQAALHTSSAGDTTISGIMNNIDEVAGLKQKITELEKKLAEVCTILLISYTCVDAIISFKANEKKYEDKSQ